jgi:hypothetical protein
MFCGRQGAGRQSQKPVKVASKAVGGMSTRAWPAGGLAATDGMKETAFPHFAALIRGLGIILPRTLGFSLGVEGFLVILQALA